MSYIFFLKYQKKMSTLGIYPKNFLGKYTSRAKNFECFYCHLVSPKNYFIECQHCICQKCIQFKRYCSICHDKMIRLNGDNPTAFQFIVTEKMINTYLMKCIFKPCIWTGMYHDFIHGHYDECQFKQGNKLMKEYFEEFEKEEINRKCKSELKVAKRNNKNKNKFFLYDNYSDDDVNSSSSYELESFDKKSEKDDKINNKKNIYNNYNYNNYNNIYNKNYYNDNSKYNNNNENFIHLKDDSESDNKNENEENHEIEEIEDDEKEEENESENKEEEEEEENEIEEIENENIEEEEEEEEDEKEEEENYDQIEEISDEKDNVIVHIKDDDNSNDIEEINESDEEKIKQGNKINSLLNKKRIYNRNDYDYWNENQNMNFTYVNGSYPRNNGYIYNFKNKKFKL